MEKQGNFYTKKEAKEGGFCCSKCGWKPAEDWPKHKKKVRWNIEGNGIGYCEDCDDQFKDEDEDEGV